jgi:hypothetical protein
MAAAERIICSHPSWSDRAIAAAAGLGARTVASIRCRMGTDMAGANGRIGRDGRVRPLNGSQGRLKASEIIANFPEASLRQVAEQAGISPATVRDVRERMRRGNDPVPLSPRSGNSRSNPARPDASAHRATPGADLASLLVGLKKDPSLRFTESGRALLRWIFARVIRPGDWQNVAVEVPPHCTYIVANVARRCAGEWLQFASDLEERARRMA